MKFGNTIFQNQLISTWLLLLVTFSVVNAQVSLSSQLIGATGNYSSNGNLSVSSSVGELAVQTFFSNNHYLTQGFQQPTNEELSFSTNSLNVSCADADNGYAEVQVKTGLGPFQYLWQPLEQSSASVKNLKPGIYTVKVTDARGFSLVDTLKIGQDYEGACGLHIYSGLTPNGDNNNDFWIIDGINEFPNNHVLLYNRWGDKVWEKSDYNNSDVVWDGTNMKNERLPDGTYFYLLTIENKKYKGWVELTR